MAFSLSKTSELNFSMVNILIISFFKNKDIITGLYFINLPKILMIPALRWFSELSNIRNIFFMKFSLDKSWSNL